MDELPNDAFDVDIQDAEGLLPAFDVDVDTVSIVDGIWLDQPDNVAAFVEARLGDLARGRGNLYLCLDVSGEVEGRSEIERALIEVLRDTFATSRGSISFGLSEALRAANAHLFESNRQVAREMRRMAGISAVVLRGNDLYIAQAGPAVVYVEASEKLARYPHESDWFVEDAPLIAPQGGASPPLGIRREFTCDLAHTSVGEGDVFVLATRALTQLATTEELAIAFTERSTQEIARHLEQVGEDADLTALIAELMNPLTAHLNDDGHAQDTFESERAHIESLPVPLATLVSLDEAEPELETPLDETADEPELEWEQAPNVSDTQIEHELNWDDAEPEPELAHASDAESESNEIETEREIPQPVFAAAAAATVMPALNAPAPQPTREEWDAELAQRRAERAAKRAAQQENVSRAVGGVTTSLAAAVTAVTGFLSRTVGGADWDGFGKRTNRFLNLGLGALITFFILLVRLVLPGVSPRTTSLIPRRATSEPVWLKALAIALPVLFIALAFGRYFVEVGNASARYDALVAEADTQVKQAEVTLETTEKRDMLNKAMTTIQSAQKIRDSQQARAVLYRIQDQLNEMDGVAVLYFLPTIAQIGGGQLKQVATSDQDVFLLDRRGQVYQYVVNDASGEGTPGENSGVLLKVGEKVGETTVEQLQLMTVASPSQSKANLVAVSQDALLLYDPESKQWSATKIEDAKEWGELRGIESFGGNVYLLDGTNNQIYRYSPNGAGYTTKAVHYFSAENAPLLNKAVDLSIDGDVWILNDNGAVLRFRAGKAVPFQLATLPLPLKNPVAIFTRPEVDSLYIADAGNQRIVEFDKNGAFVRQYKPYSLKGDVFQNLQDFTVNETKRKIYFINRDAAYMANIQK